MPLTLARRAGRNAIEKLAELVRPQSRAVGQPSPEEIATACYRALLGREPDPAGLAGSAGVLRSGDAVENVLRAFVESPEFRARMMRTLVPAAQLPDLTLLMPERYRHSGPGSAPLYLARTDSDAMLMESLIRKHRYYDRFDVWSPVIDPDKRLIAAVVRALGARSCFELGCFTGPVLSLLADAGIDVAGCDASHHAFAFAYPNVRDAMFFGDLLELDLERKFDAVVCMDVLEHLNPLKLGDYIARLVSLLDDTGRIYINSPMWGHDDIFGTVADPFVDEWRAVGDRDFWREWPCDAAGWPQHGHLVWASPQWWTAQFAAQGLQRDAALEAVIHRNLAPHFDREPSRRSLFVLCHPNGTRSSAAQTAAFDARLADLSAAEQ
jgi:SAM-dependent methyltransferase